MQVNVTPMDQNPKRNVHLYIHVNKRQEQIHIEYIRKARKMDAKYNNNVPYNSHVEPPASDVTITGVPIVA